MQFSSDDAGAGILPAPLARLHSAIRRLALVCAAAGGVVLLGMALMTTASVISRAVANQPIYGIFELVELFTGIAVLSFFPYTHITRGNVVAEFFTQSAPERIRHALEFLADLTFLAIACFACWRVAVGFHESLDSLDRSFVLNMPEWVFYGPATVWMVLLVIVSVAAAVLSGWRLAR
ncbi:TRAP transporter small permease [Anianabacter salinae]|uniref:TRAP transporter small permease n=1 Tax=Anianabacter salinae TaxID=2851023 RepID=UPI00225DD655|nr:TRAP transporter small permease [Anianabacter salinae]MBV0913831.1 TRAP transporter small permease [Anianabacter salinae]